MESSHLLKNKAFIRLLKPHEHCSTGGGEEHAIETDHFDSMNHVVVALKGFY